MGFKQVLIYCVGIIGLIGGILYLTLGFLAIADNKVVYEKLISIEKYKKKVENKTGKTINLDEIIVKEKTNIIIELFIASVIDFLLMSLCYYKINLNSRQYSVNDHFQLLDENQKDLENENKNESITKTGDNNIETIN